MKYDGIPNNILLQTLSNYKMVQNGIKHNHRIEPISEYVQYTQGEKKNICTISSYLFHISVSWIKVGLMIGDDLYYFFNPYMRKKDLTLQGIA